MKDHIVGADVLPGPRYGVVEGLVLIAVRFVALLEESAGAFKPVIWRHSVNKGNLRNTERESYHPVSEFSEDRCCS